MNSINSSSSYYSQPAYLPEEAISRSGIKFYPKEDVWIWFDGVNKIHLNFPELNLQNDLLNSLKASLYVIATTQSPVYVRNLFEVFKNYWRVVGEIPGAENGISVALLSKFEASLSSKSKYRLGTLAALLNRWNSLELPGLERDCIAYLNSKTIGGNVKGEFVRNRDPLNGPFTESEYIAIYKAVDAAWLRKEIPLWLYVLNRIIFASGGRTSQYASLKIKDFKFEGDLCIMSLPQVKKRNTNAREELRDFPLSPQTALIVREYIDYLYSIQLSAEDAFLPECLITEKADSSSRSEGDLFNGHCQKHNLSIKFTKLMSKISPPSERLEFSPTPINIRRYRYTYGTRLVEEGVSELILADRLGHTDNQHTTVYYEASPKVVENIDLALNQYLAPLADAFKGRIIKNEADSTHKGALGSRIIDFKASKRPIASCAGVSCSFNKPVACYTCSNFEPWLDGPHQEVLDRLLKERELLKNDERISKINDAAIIAVRQVIANCEYILKASHG